MKRREKRGDRPLLAGRENAGESARPELVIGLTAAVGTPLDLVESALSSAFVSLGYGAETLRLSEYIDSFELKAAKSNRGEAGRIDAAMRRGNEARRKTGRDDILALAAIAEIRRRRGPESRALPARAFVLRQLKRPEEVQLLRQTYGAGFVLIGVYSSREEREKFLKQHGTRASEIASLILRDEHESELGGQSLRDTFHLADLFIEVGGDPAGAEREVKRATHLLLGLGISTPTRAEFGMFQAYAASLRSAQLGRQVGACLLSGIGDVISVGTNEAPRFGGGLYWEGEPPDARDHQLGRDSSDEAKEEILREILEKIDPEWRRASVEEKQRLFIDRLERLASTRITSLTEFGRAVHAEAEAIVSAARMGVSTRETELYCTTFPCHVCAKHIVAAGIRSVTFIEPYPKSRALDLHKDSISLEVLEEKKVVFRPFVGVAPRAFARLFSMKTADGIENPRKDERGHAILDQMHARVGMTYFSSLQREDLAAQDLDSITRKGAKR